MRRSLWLRSVSLLAVLALAATACGDDDTVASNPTTAVAPTSTVSTTTGPEVPTTVAVPSTTEPGKSTVEVLTFVDPTRETAAEGGFEGAPDRTIETTVYLPPTTEPRPLIILSHGLAGHPDKFQQLGYLWADEGYVVAVPKFPLSSNELIDPWFGDVAQQAVDVGFVHDSLAAVDESSPVADRIDFDRVGLAGVSLGGLTNWNTLLEGCCDQMGVDGLIASDTTFPFDPTRADEIEIPVLTVHSDVDFTFAYDDQRAIWDEMPTPKFFLTVHNGMHAQASENDDTPHAEAFQLATSEFWARVFGETPIDEPFPAELTTDGVTTFDAEPG